MGVLNQIYDFVDWLLGLGLEARDIGIARMSLRALVVFVISIAIIRVGDKRFLGRNTLLDVMLGIVFGSVVSRAITGNAPFFPALAASLVLVLAHFALAAIAFRHHWFGKIVKGHDQLLVKNGEIQADAARSCAVTRHDLEEAMRTKGHFPDISKISEAYMERNGEISIIMKNSADKKGQN